MNQGIPPNSRGNRFTQCWSRLAKVVHGGLAVVSSGRLSNVLAAQQNFWIAGKWWLFRRWLRGKRIHVSVVILPSNRPPRQAANDSTWVPVITKSHSGCTGLSFCQNQPLDSLFLKSCCNKLHLPVTHNSAVPSLFLLCIREPLKARKHYTKQLALLPEKWKKTKWNRNKSHQKRAGLEKLTFIKN
jgi:hypothetical protein